MKYSSCKTVLLKIKISSQRRQGGRFHWLRSIQSPDVNFVCMLCTALKLLNAVDAPNVCMYVYYFCGMQFLAVFFCTLHKLSSNVNMLWSIWYKDIQKLHDLIRSTCLFMRLYLIYYWLTVARKAFKQPSKGLHPLPGTIVQQCLICSVATGADRLWLQL